MADEDVVIGVRTVGTEETAASFDAVKRKLEALGPEAQASFQKIIESETTAEQKSRDMAAALEAYALKATEAITSSTLKVEDKTEALAGLKEGFESAAREAREFGDTTERATDPLDDRFARIRETFESFENSVEQGSPRMRGQLDRLIIQQKNLEDAIEKSFGSVSEATPEVIAQYNKIEREIDQAKGKVRELTDELQEQRTELQEGGESWTGLGDAFNKAAGPAGALAAKAGLITAAFTEGWGIGSRWAQAMGTDMSELDRVTDGLNKKLGRMFAALADAAVEGFQGNWKAAANALREADAALILTEKELRGLKAAQDAGVEGFKGLGSEAAQLTKVSEFYTEAMRSGIEGQKLWNQAVSDSGGSSQGLLTAIDGLLPTLATLKASYAATTTETNIAKGATDGLAGAKNLAEQIAGLTAKLNEEKAALADSTLDAGAASGNAAQFAEMQNYLAANVDRAKAAVEAQRAKIAELTLQYGEGDAVTRSATETLAQLESVLASAQKRVAENSAELARYSSQQQEAEQRAEAHRRAVEQQTKQLADLNAKQQETATASAVSAEATTAQAAATTRATEGSKSYIEFGGKRVEVEEKFVQSAGSSAQTIRDVGDAAAETAGRVASLTANVLALAAAFDSVRDAASQASGEIERASNAGMDDVEDGGGTGTYNTGGFTLPT
jgi:chromosome segregation ATPase